MLIFGLISLNKVNHKFFHHTTAGAAAGMFRPYPKLDASATRNAYLEALPQPLRHEMAATFVPVTVIEVALPPTTLLLESSAYGGCPLLPPGEDWPAYQGQPLDFLVQINLAEVVDFLPEGIPHQGLLSFFNAHKQPWGNETEDLGSARIIYAPSPDECFQVESHKGGSLLHRQGLSFRTEIAQQISEDLNTRFFSYFRSLTGDAERLLDQLQDRVIELNPFENRLFSAPAPVQNSMEGDLRVASKAYGLREDTQWTMILQIDSVKEQDWCWGDERCLYFWIPTDDLMKARFDRWWVILQCT